VSISLSAFFFAFQKERLAIDSDSYRDKLATAHPTSSPGPLRKTSPIKVGDRSFIQVILCVKFLCGMAIPSVALPVKCVILMNGKIEAQKH
jgi:hypothetical protein